MDILPEVVERVGKINDKADRNLWEVAEAVETAFAEFPAYEQGLALGLHRRLRKSVEQVYNLRNAAVLRARLKSKPVLSVSHYSRMSRLANDLNLEDDIILDWLEAAEGEHLSVGVLAAHVHAAHDGDPEATFHRSLDKTFKRLEMIYDQYEYFKVPEDFRADTRRAIDAHRKYRRRANG